MINYLHTCVRVCVCVCVYVYVCFQQVRAVVEKALFPAEFRRMLAFRRMPLGIRQKLRNMCIKIFKYCKNFQISSKM